MTRMDRIIWMGVSVFLLLLGVFCGSNLQRVKMSNSSQITTVPEYYVGNIN